MLIYGKNPVKDLFLKNPKLIKKVYVSRKRHSFFVTELEKEGIPIEDISKVFKQFSKNENTQDIVAEVQPPKYFSLEEIITIEKSKVRPIILILDQIQDPQNFGSIMRNAVAFGVESLIIPKNNAAPLSSGSIKASAGSWLNVNFSKSNSLTSTVDKLRKEGYWIVSTTLEGTDSMNTLKNLDQPIALILGNEGRGIRKPLINKSDIKLKISITDKVQSLNVSATTAILLYSLFNE